MSATNRGAERVPQDSYPTPRWAVRRLLEEVALPRGVWLEPCAGEGAIVREVGRYADEVRAMEILPSCREKLDAALAAANKKKRGPPAWRRSNDELSIGDYLVKPMGRRFSVIITNPPFSLGFEIAKKAVSEADFVVFLLRLNFLGSGDKSGRSEWLRQHPPDVYVLPNRPAFVASLRCVSGKLFRVADAAIRGHFGLVAHGDDGLLKCAWRATLPIEAERPKRCPVCSGRVSCSTTDATEYAWFVWRGASESGKIKILATTPASERGAHGE